ncbi:MAG: Fe(3+) ABC transporter substrate-binding protein [Acidobacteriota bacterium]
MISRSDRLPPSLPHRITLVWLAVAALLPLLLLVSCSPAEDASTATDPSASSGDATGTADQATDPNAGEPNAGDAVVNVYSARHYDTDDALIERFKAETGIDVQVIEGDSAALLERLRREGEDSPADLFITVDAGRLAQAEAEGVFQPIESAVIEERIPDNLRHPEGLWFGLTKRARVLVVAKDRVEAGAITTYEQLADPAWRGRVLIRSSSNIYNQSLMGSILAAHGEDEALAWCEGLVANLARKPQGGDRDQIRALAAGEGDVAVVNSYYLAKMLADDASPEDRAAAEQVAVVFPNQGDRGTHVNLSGAGVVRGAPHRDQAVRFLEYLTSPEAQAVFAGGNKEYPAARGVPSVPELEAFGDFEEDSLNASIYGDNNRAALMLMDRCGWR